MRTQTNSEFGSTRRGERPVGVRAGIIVGVPSRTVP